MLDYRDFEQVFAFDPNHNYDQRSVQGIESHRRNLQGLLFVDRVLKLLGIKRPAKIYPPKSNKDLRALHQAIIDAPATDHPKLSLLYYILLDTDVSTRNNNHSNYFEEKVYLPNRYQIYMKGLWHMDHLQFESALQYLTHSSLIPTFPDEILEALVQHAPANDVSLALAYYQTVQPTLSSPKAINSLFTAISRVSVTDAFYYSRAQSEHSHRHMLEILISQVLSQTGGPEAAERGLELVNLPFNTEEEKWFEEYLTIGNGKDLNKAKDTVMLRKVGTGNFKDALAIEGFNSRSIAGLDWSRMQDAIKGGLGQKR